MFGWKDKPPVERGRARQIQNSNPASPAFSYYARTRPEAADARRATPERQSKQAAPTVPKRPVPKLSQLPYVLLLIVIVICLVKLVILNTNPKVVVVGNTTATGSYVQSVGVYAQAAHNVLGSSIANRTKLTADISGTTAALQREFPELQTASLTVPLVGNRPVLYVQAAPPSLVLQTGGGNYALNRTGVVLAKLQTVPAHVPLLSDQAPGSSPVVGRAYLPGSTVAFIQTLSYQFTAAQLPVATYVLPASNAYELDMRLAGKPYTVRFNLEANAMEQSGAAIATIQQLGNTVPSTYLDMRTPERAYYK